MSRLLFAAARKARIERRHFKDPVWLWEKARLLLILDHDTTDTDYVWRIHPEDIHLAYGPISTALRHAALGLEVTDSCWFSNLSVHSDGPVELMTDHERTLFLLLTAEALADEGL